MPAAQQSPHHPAKASSARTVANLVTPQLPNRLAARREQLQRRLFPVRNRCVEGEGLGVGIEGPGEGGATACRHRDKPLRGQAKTMSVDEPGEKVRLGHTDGRDVHRGGTDLSRGLRVETEGNAPLLPVAPRPRLHPSQGVEVHADVGGESRVVVRVGAVRPRPASSSHRHK
eukprot:COSAG04_NODE_9499_length_858_cov_1.386034_1_plen_172_part_00